MEGPHGPRTQVPEGIRVIKVSMKNYGWRGPVFIPDRLRTDHLHFFRAVCVGGLPLYLASSKLRRAYLSKLGGISCFYLNN